MHAVGISNMQTLGKPLLQPMTILENSRVFFLMQTQLLSDLISHLAAHEGGWISDFDWFILSSCSLVLSFSTLIVSCFGHVPGVWSVHGCHSPGLHDHHLLGILCAAPKALSAIGSKAGGACHRTTKCGDHQGGQRLGKQAHFSLNLGISFG